MRRNGMKFRRDHPKDEEMRTARKLRIVYVILTILYASVVISATLNVVVIQPARMPRVETIPRDEITAAIPKRCITEAADGSPVVNILQKAQGAWGMQYYVRQIPVIETQEIDEDRLFVVDAIGIEGSIITSATVDFLEDGMEVRLIQHVD